MLSARVTVPKNNFHRLTGGNLTRRIAELVKATAQKVAARAKANIIAVGAVDTGATLDSIDATQIADLIWSIGPHTDYAVFIEMGTRRMAARPFLIPALEAEMPAFQVALRALIEQEAA